MNSSGAREMEGAAVWVLNTPTKAAALTSVQARITWTKRPVSRAGRAAVNRRLSAKYDKLLIAAEANTERLIGRTRL